MTSNTRVKEVLDSDPAREVLRQHVPFLLENESELEAAWGLPISVVLEYGNRLEPEVLARVWDGLGQVEAASAAYAASIDPDPGYEGDDVDRSSAALNAPAEGALWETYEIRLAGPSHGNPFVDVDLWADFASGDMSVHVGGFYDGDGAYGIRFLPPFPGEWTFVTGSTARSLDGLTGQVSVSEGSGVGPVRVDGTFHFRYANGDRFRPVGTTAYAWTHQPSDLEERTLLTLATAPFTKIRMCVFPKSMEYNRNDPERYPFIRDGDGWDLTRFDPDYFRHLEDRIRDLGSLGIEADLILFHPYDRWGFMDLGPAVDERFLQYVVRRLAAIPNVWWSMANEYDLMWSKDLGEWDRLARVVVAEDHAGHLISIHNGAKIFDYSADWVTHCSIQRTEIYRTTENVTEWRRRWNKPVIVDEFGYEGDIDWSWGNLTAQEFVRRMWEATARGGYGSHGETYWRQDEVLWWSKGGDLFGESPARIAFLDSLVAQSPTGVFEPVQAGEYPAGGEAGVYEIHYFGLSQPSFENVRLVDGKEAEIDVIDTWAMSCEPLPGRHGGTVRVPLPARQYMAIRVRYLG